MQKYTGSTELPEYGGNRANLQEIWLIISDFLFFTLKQFKLKVPDPLEALRSQPDIELPVAIRIIFGSQGEQSADTRPAWTDYWLRNIEAWNQAVGNPKMKAELKAIAETNQKDIPYLFNLFNSAMRAHVLIAGEKIYRGMKYQRKPAPAPPRASGKGKGKGKKRGK